MFPGKLKGRYELTEANSTDFSYQHSKYRPLLPINWLNPGVTLSLLCSWLLSFTHVKQKSKMYWNEIGPVCLKS